ncbi:sensor histidine kinase [Halovenus marina]|uniref:sensor histidine kinase n=1 Tax=Halovenus marina TaxID=3396621 RepID=UPI003F544118
MSLRRSTWNSLSKRTLGEGYLLVLIVTMFVILAGLVTLEGPSFALWTLPGFLAIMVLCAVVYLLRRSELDSNQVWRIAQYGAVGTGLVTLVLVGGHLTAELFLPSPELTVALIVIIAATTGAGALVGLTYELHRTTERLRLRKSVLYRVLQHNLRNDMTVVLAHLDNVRDSVDDPQRAELDKAEQKIQALVDLTEKVRRINIAAEARDSQATPTDLVPVIEERIELLRSRYPDIDVTVSLPDAAWVYADRQFGIVIDNIVESALMYSRASPTLRVEVTAEDDTVCVCVVDQNQTIPNADLSALEQRTEDVFNHGYGVELWLVYWLTEQNGGTVSIEDDHETRALEIDLDRAESVPR